MKTLLLDELDPLPSVDFVLVTAVDVERDRMLAHFSPLNGQEAIVKLPWTESTYFLGKCGRYVCALLLCDAGSGGRDGSILAVVDAITRWSPRAVIMPGIAFGADSEKQVIGDVLVSTQVIPYELERVGTNSRIPRAPHPECGQVLLNRVKNLFWTWDTASGKTRKPKLGPVLSGEKLVDNPDFKRSLLETHKAAIGGEMEGAGLYAAAARRKVEWILIKAICDWGEGKNDDHHELAAKNACAMVAALLGEPGLDAQDFGLAPKEPETRIAREMRTARWAMNFKGVQSAIRSTEEAQNRTGKTLAEFILSNSNTGPSGEPVIPKELQHRVSVLQGENERALETWLNAYNDGCAQYRSGDVDPALFVSAFGREIRELFEHTGPHSPRLFPRETSPYEALWDVYAELQGLPS
ncbi:MULTISPECIES: hypothetical protein [Sorangium]|uniref:Nucleoside phosphorylase domain-containing protein n=1 Tax=Sorangium cellulosum TaxID=56 RepID=A0A4V0NFY3_SORCE|nr:MULTISPECIES: hypothetical protein [Sorangium]AUX31272.1 uncharacterized protein SOCE836_034010 [Sorangium cellulosum]WCQ90656.1 hypothetical protein NQZ70_03367 [Sorangium sp. Soce836]